ncbi:MAG: CGNR zinc finger domain-containing protein [Acidimicrobiales bacterium]
MDPLPLDPGSYGGTYKLVGGQVSLDLVNTVSWPGTAREHDWFDPPANLLLWAQTTGLAGEPTRRRFDREMRADPARLASQIAAVARIRHTLRSAIAPLARGESPPDDAIRDLNRLLAATCGRRQVDPETLEWAWLEPATLPEVMAPAVHNAAEVLTSIDPRRLRHCPSCDWLFHDTTRNASRRWCDMADCGSRDKALRYYHRHKPSS